MHTLLRPIDIDIASVSLRSLAHSSLGSNLVVFTTLSLGEFINVLVQFIQMLFLVLKFLLQRKEPTEYASLAFVLVLGDGRGDGSYFSCSACRTYRASSEDSRLVNASL